MYKKTKRLSSMVCLFLAVLMMLSSLPLGTIAGLTNAVKAQGEPTEPTTYNVVFYNEAYTDADATYNEHSTSTVEEDGKIAAPGSNPTAPEGQVFDGWREAGAEENYNFDTEVTADVYESMKDGDVIKLYPYFVDDGEDEVDEETATNPYASLLRFDSTTGTVTGFNMDNFEETNIDLVIPDKIGDVSVVAIGDKALMNVPLKSVKIPTAVTSIGKSAFQGIVSLTTVNFSELSALQSIGDYAFTGTSVSGDVTMPAALQTIGSNSFQSTKLTSIVLPEGMQSIGVNAFSKCPSLVSANWPASVGNNMGAHAFEVTGLTSIVIPDTVTVLNGYQFANTRLSSITLSSNLVEIKDHSFSNINTLREETVVIPASVKTISSYAFVNTTVKIFDFTAHWPDAVSGKPWGSGGAVSPPIVRWKSTDNSCFYINDAGCIVGLKEAGHDHDVDGGCQHTSWHEVGQGEWIIPAKIRGITTTGLIEKAFLGDIYAKSIAFEDGHAITEIASNSISNRNLTTLVVPEGVETIKKQGIQSVNKITSLSLPSTLRVIETSGIQQTGLTSIELPEGLTTLAPEALYGNMHLKEADIPSTVTSIGSQVFRACGIEEIVIKGDEAIEIDPQAFANTNLKITDINIKGRYKADVDNEPWNAIYANVHWHDESDDPIVIYTKDGWVFNRQTGQLIDYIGETGDKVDLVVPIKVTGKDGETEFDVLECTKKFESTTFKSITFEEGLTTTGEKADVIIPTVFFKNGVVQKIDLNDAMTKIPYAMFSLCKIGEIELHEGITSIGDYAFDGCIFDTDPILPSTVTYIGGYAFRNCGLTEIILPSSLQTIGANAFSDNQLSTITIPDSVSIIYEQAFANNNLTGSIKIGSGAKTIRDTVFAGNENLSRIVVDQTRDSVGGSPWGAPNDTVVQWKGSVALIEAEVIPVTNDRARTIILSAKVAAGESNIERIDLVIIDGNNAGDRFTLKDVFATEGNTQTTTLNYEVLENGTYTFIVKLYNNAGTGAEEEYDVVIDDIGQTEISASNIELKQSEKGNFTEAQILNMLNLQMTDADSGITGNIETEGFTFSLAEGELDRINDMNSINDEVDVVINGKYTSAYNLENNVYKATYEESNAWPFGPVTEDNTEYFVKGSESDAYNYYNLGTTTAKLKLAGYRVQFVAGDNGEYGRIEPTDLSVSVDKNSLWGANFGTGDNKTPVPTPNPKEGYYFAGWQRGNDTNEIKDPAENKDYQITDNVTYTAIFKPKTDIELRGKSAAKDYNTQMQNVTGYDVHNITGIDASDETAMADAPVIDNLTFVDEKYVSLTHRAEGTDAGTYTGIFSEDDAGKIIVMKDGVNVTNQYNITLKTGALTINPLDVTITADSSTDNVFNNTTFKVESTDENPHWSADPGDWNIDGNSIEGLEVYGAQRVVGESDVTFRAKEDGEIKLGSEKLTLSSPTTEGSQTLTGAKNYNITLVKGTVEVLPASDLEWKLIGEKPEAVPYDGKSHTANGSVELPEGFYFDGRLKDYTQTNAGGYTFTPEIDGDYSIYYLEVDDDHTTKKYDATGWFNTPETVDGSLTINKVPVTLTANSSTGNKFDTTIHEVTGTSFTGTDALVKNETITGLEVFGQRQTPGSSDVLFVGSDVKVAGKSLNFNAEDQTLTGATNYIFTLQKGSVEVLPEVDAKYDWSITGEEMTKAYTGIPQSNTEFEVENLPDGFAYASGITVDGATRTNVMDDDWKTGWETTAPESVKAFQTFNYTKAVLTYTGSVEGEGAYILDGQDGRARWNDWFENPDTTVGYIAIEPVNVDVELELKDKDGNDQYAIYAGQDKPIASIAYNSFVNGETTEKALKKQSTINGMDFDNTQKGDYNISLSKEDQANYYNYTFTHDDAKVEKMVEVYTGGRVFYHDNGVASNIELDKDPKVYTPGETANINFDVKTTDSTQHFVFLGWSEKKTDTTPTYKADGTKTVTFPDTFVDDAHAINLYAIWAVDWTKVGELQNVIETYDGEIHSVTWKNGPVANSDITWTVDGVADADNEFIDVKRDDQNAVQSYMVQATMTITANGNDYTSPADQTNLTATATINPLERSITADDVSINRGENEPLSQYKWSWTDGKEPLTRDAITVTPNYLLDPAYVANGEYSSYTIDIQGSSFADNATIAGAGVGNYTFTKNNGTLTVEPLDVSLSAVGKINTDSKFYGVKDVDQAAFDALFNWNTDLPAGFNPDHFDVKVNREAGESAGTYDLHATITIKEGYENCYTIAEDKITETDGYTIKRAVLTIVPDDKTITYSDGVPTDFNYTLKGLIVNEELKIDDESNPPKLTGVTLETNYKQGDDVGGYDITVADVKGIDVDPDNYTIAAEQGRLTVEAKVLDLNTLKVADAEKTYTAVDPTYDFEAWPGDYNRNEFTINFTREKANNAEGENAAKYAITADLIPAGNNYRVINEVQNGILTINPMDVTITPADNSKYEGQADPIPLTTEDVKFNEVSNPIQGFTRDTLNYTIVRNGDEAPGTYDITINETNNPNYRIKANTATFEIIARTDWTITAGSAEGTYNGQTITVDGFTTDLPEGYAVAGYSVNASLKDAGNTVVTPQLNGDWIITDDQGQDISHKYNTPTVINGSIDIAQKDVAVWANSDTVRFDGEKHIVNTWGTDGLVGSDRLTDVTAYGEGIEQKTKPGYEVVLDITKAKINGEAYVEGEGNYKLIPQNGELNILDPDQQLAWTITGDSDSFTYSGMENSINTFTTTLPKGYLLEGVSAEGLRTDVGFADVVVTVGEWKIKNATGVDVTSMYGNPFRQNGTLTVNALKANVKAADQSFTFDPLNIEEKTYAQFDDASAAMAKDLKGVTVKGSITFPGTAENTVIVSQDATYKGLAIDGRNVILTTENGTLTMDEPASLADWTITGTTTTLTYDGNAHMTAYDISGIDTNDYTVTIVGGTAGKDVGTYTSNYAGGTINIIHNATGENVTRYFNAPTVQEATITINPLTAKVIAGSSTFAYDAADPSAKSYEAFTTDPADAVGQLTGIIVRGSISAPGTAANVVVVGTAATYKGLTVDGRNVIITTEDGVLTMTGEIAPPAPTPGGGDTFTPATPGPDTIIGTTDTITGVIAALQTPVPAPAAVIGGIADGTPEAGTDAAILDQVVEDEVPLANRNTNGWSLLSLLMGLISMALAVVSLIVLIKNRRKEADGDENIVYEVDEFGNLADITADHTEFTEDEGTEEAQRRAKIRSKVMKVLNCITGLLPIIVFLIVDNLNIQMVWINRFTPYIALLFLLNVIVLAAQIFIQKQDQKDNDEANDDDYVTD